MDVGLVRVGIAQDRRRVSLGDHITRLEIAECDRQAARGDVGHVLGLDQRIAEQRGRLARGQARLEQERAVGGLELADRRRGRRVHHEHGALPIGRAQRLHQVDQLVRRVGARERARGAGADRLQCAHRPHAVERRRVRRSQEAQRLVGPIPADERLAFGARELGRDLVRQEFLDVEHRVVEHLLRHRRVGVELAAGRHDLGERRRIGLRPRRLEPDPARRSPAARDQLAIARAPDLDDVGDRPDRRDRDQSLVDRAVDFLGHRIAADRVGRAADRLGLEPALDPAPQILVDEARGLGRLDPVERRPLRRDRAARDLRLERLQLGLEPRDPVLFLLERIERRLERIRLHFHHSRLLPCTNKKGRDFSRPSPSIVIPALSRDPPYSFILLISSQFGMQLFAASHSFQCLMISALDGGGGGASSCLIEIIRSTMTSLADIPMCPYIPIPAYSERRPMKSIT
jgi:hypothetical protein